MDWVFACVLSVPVLLIVIWGLNCRHYRKKANNQLERLAFELGTERRGRGFSGRYEDVAYSLDYSSRADESPNELGISVDWNAGTKMIVRRSGFIGLSQKIDTGDPEFDRMCFIETEDVLFAGKYFAEEKRRRAVLNLFSLKCDSIVIDKCLRGRWKRFPMEEADAQDIKSILADLVILRADLPDVTAAERSSFPAQPRMSLRLNVAAIAVLVVLLPAMLLVYQDSYRVLDEGALFRQLLNCTIPVCILLLFAFVRLVKARRILNGPTVAFCIFCMLAVGFSGQYLGRITNAAYDRGKPMGHDVLIVRKEKESGEFPRHYLHVASWRRGEPELVRVDHETFDRARERGRIMLLSKPGKLGFEWVAAFKLVN